MKTEQRTTWAEQDISIYMWIQVKQMFTPTPMFMLTMYPRCSTTSGLVNTLIADKTLLPHVLRVVLYCPTAYRPPWTPFFSCAFCWDSITIVRALVNERNLINCTWLIVQYADLDIFPPRNNMKIYWKDLEMNNAR